MRRFAWLVLLLAGCAQAPDVTVSVYQTRSDTPVDKIEIQVQNNEDAPVTVQSAQLVSTQLTAFPVWEEDVEIPAGAAMDLKVSLPPALCTGEAVDEVVLMVDDQRLTMSANDRLGQLAQYRAQQCFEQGVDRSGGFRIIGLRGARLMFATALQVGPIGTTTLFRPTQQTAHSVRLTPNRCDAHALAEDKQGTYFPVPVTLPDGQTGEFVADVDQDVRGQLYRLYARLCGL